MTVLTVTGRERSGLSLSVWSARMDFTLSQEDAQERTVMNLTKRIRMFVFSAKRTTTWSTMTQDASLNALLTPSK